MPAKKIAKNQLDSITLAIIFYFIEKLDGVLGKTHLQKLLFLSDLIAVKKFKKQFTKLEYQKYKFGPYSEMVDCYINHLEQKGLIEVRELPFFSDKTKTYNRFYSTKKSNVRGLLKTKLGSEKLLVLDEIISSYGNMSLKDVLDIVYELEFVQKSKMRSPLNIAQEIQEQTDEEPDIEENFLLK